MTSYRKLILAFGLAGAMFALPAFGAEETIDDYSSATNTAFISGMQVRQASLAAGFASGTDMMLTGVLGGTRIVDVDLEASAADTILGVTAGVNVGLGLFQYSEDPTADGLARISYPSIPKGLAFADGIEVTLNADATAALGYTVSLTLTDAMANTATVSTPSMATGLGIPFSFSFSSFPTVDPGNLAAIVITLDGGGSQDIQLELTTTFGTPPRETDELCQNGIDDDNDEAIDCLDSDCLSVDPCGSPAPALSPSGMGFAALVLLATGLLAMLRLRRSA